MMDVKKALDEADGDMAKAEEILRVKGLKGVTKCEGRTASNGLVTARAGAGEGTLVEVLCETDFVAKGSVSRPRRPCSPVPSPPRRPTPTSCSSSTLSDGKSVKELLDEANATIGEKIEVKRVARPRGEHVVSYLHKTSPDLPAQIGVLVSTAGGDEQTARDVAMHIAAFSPSVLTREEIDADTVENERRVAEATAKEEGKPEAALLKIIEGRANGYFKENVLRAAVRQGAQEDRREGPAGVRRRRQGLRCASASGADPAAPRIRYAVRSPRAGGTPLSSTGSQASADAATGHRRTVASTLGDPPVGLAPHVLGAHDGAGLGADRRGAHRGRTRARHR